MATLFLYHLLFHNTHMETITGTPADISLSMSNLAWKGIAMRRGTTVWVGWVGPKIAQNAK